MEEGWSVLQLPDAAEFLGHQANLQLLQSEQFKMY